MPKAYVIAYVDVTDPAAYDEYRHPFGRYTAMRSWVVSEAARVAAAWQRRSA